MIGDRREDLRRIQDLVYLTRERLEHLGEVAPVLDDYLRLRSQMHLHFGVRLGDEVGEAREYCALLEGRPSGWRLPGDESAIAERYLALHGSESREKEMKLPVLVIVRELRDAEERIIGGLPSLVSVSRLDEVDGDSVDPRKATAHVPVEGFCCGVDRELDSGGSLVIQWPSHTVSYELPSEMVERAPIVVHRFPEAGGERIRRLGRRASDDELAVLHRTDACGALVAFWLDTAGYIGVTVEEPACLTYCDGLVEVRPSELRSRAAEGIGFHAR